MSWRAQNWSKDAKTPSDLRAICPKNLDWVHDQSSHSTQSALRNVASEPRANYYTVLTKLGPIVLYDILPTYGIDIQYLAICKTIDRYRRTPGNWPWRSCCYVGPWRSCFANVYAYLYAYP